MPSTPSTSRIREEVTKKCTSCQTVCSVEASVCPICGETLDTAKSSHFTPRQSKHVTPMPIMTCTSCGTKCSADSQFCHICGEMQYLQKVSDGDPWRRRTLMSSTAPSEREVLSWNTKAVLKVRTSTGAMQPFPSDPASPSCTSELCMRAP